MIARSFAFLALVCRLVGLALPIGERVGLARLRNAHFSPLMSISQADHAEAFAANSAIEQ